MNPANARRCFRDGTDILDKLGISYWVDAGTLLGAYRDGFSDEFLQHDTDIDVITLDNNAIWKFSTLAMRSGFSFHEGYGVLGRWTKVSFIKHVVIFEIYRFEETHDKIVCHTRQGLITYPKEFVLPLGSLEIDGKECPAPANIEGYLRTVFGEGWVTPEREPHGHWWEKTKNLKPDQVPTDEIKITLEKV